jgi:tetraacyldisaccharide 4'-kinase
VRLIERVWRGEDNLSHAARLALVPLAMAYRGATAARSWMYARGILSATSSAIPVVSIGNLSVGGTGKTPFAAWLASEIEKRGARPAIVLRGYGGDENIVHARLNPRLIVVIDPDRTRGIATAAKQGATVAVLDDAFQHLAAARNFDVVLVSAEQWSRPLHLLPAGPWREPLASLRRASLVVVTRKMAADAKVTELRAEISRVAPAVPQAVVRFRLGDLVRVTVAGSAAASMPLSAIAGHPVTAVAGIADPQAFFAQLLGAGAGVAAVPFPDHHQFGPSDVATIVAAGGAKDAIVVCTLKDAVKLAGFWPASAPPLWYVSQALEIESGVKSLGNLLDNLSPKRASNTVD